MLTSSYRTLTLPDAEVEEVFFTFSELGMEIRDPDEVVDYLLAHPSLLKPLTQVTRLVRAHFPPSSRIWLSLFRDSYVDDQYLTLVIRQVASEVDLLKRIWTVSERCWPLLKDSSGWLHITADFCAAASLSA